MYWQAWVRFADWLGIESHSESAYWTVTDRSGRIWKGRSVTPKPGSCRSAQLSSLMPVLSEVLHLKSPYTGAAFWALRSTRTARSMRTCLLTAMQQMVSRWVMYSAWTLLQTDKSQQPRLDSPISMQTFFHTFQSAFAAIQWQQDYPRDDLLVVVSVY
jgi:hypothetical protein